MKNIFLDANVIYDAGTKAMRGSAFKYATQLFEMNHLLYTAMIQKDLQEGTYRPEVGNKFLINERGKPRFITSNTMADKTVNHIISDEILMPSLSKYLIYDNGASQKGKGVAFHRKRFENHLRLYFIQHGNNEGYILLGDFSGYYANIPHDKYREVLEHFLTRELEAKPDELKYTLWLLDEMFKTFRVDVSRFSDEEIQSFREGKVDQMLNLYADPKTLTGEKFLDKGVDIGNQNSQSIGLIYPYRFDNFAKIVKRIKYYGRYTDDFYAIAEERETLENLLDGLRVIAKEFGLIINERKTRIVKLSSFYRHLQNGYSLTKTGRVIRRINSKSITRERGKLKAYKRLLDKGIMIYDDIENIFKSWLGGNFKRMSQQQIYNMTDLFVKLFGRIPTWKKRTFTVTLADGTTLSELDLNGNNFISYKEVKPETFAGKLSNVKITGSEEADEAGLIGEHNNMELIQIQQHGSEYWFILRDIPADKLAMTKLQSDVAYLSMMSGIDLE